MNIKKKKKKVSHNNDLIPTYETNKKQTDQTEDTNRTEEINRKQKKQTHAERIIGKVFDSTSNATPEFLLLIRTLHFS